MIKKIEKPIILEDVDFRESISQSDKNEWSWVNIKNGRLENPANYYESSLNKWDTFEKLTTAQECDVVVIGGGLLGASTALHLSEQGVDTTLIEKNRIGSAASGRNGGQLTPGLARWEASDMIKKFSYDDAKKLWNFTSFEAMDLIDKILEKYDVNAARAYGHITAAVHEGHMNALKEGAEARLYLGDQSTAIIEPDQLDQYVNSKIYKGALLDNIGGHIHPLALNRTLIYGFHKNGGTVYENTEALSVQEQADGIYVYTESGVIKAKKAVVMAVHQSSSDLLNQKKQTAIPFYTYVTVTEPLNFNISNILPLNHPVYDTQIQIDYYRAVSKNRLLFGGQGTGTSWNPDHINHYLKGRIKNVFPQLENIALDFTWSGVSDLTVNGAADCRKFGEKYPIYNVHGWSGHGVAQTVRIGKAISDDFLGNTSDYSMLTKINHINIPFGNFLAPLALPVAKSWFGLLAKVNPGKMVSF